MLDTFRSIKNKINKKLFTNAKKPKNPQTNFISGRSGSKGILNKNPQNIAHKSTAITAQYEDINGK